MRYFGDMETVSVALPAELVREAGWSPDNLAAEAAAVLALDLFRLDKVSLGRAAELCGLPVARFLELAAMHRVPLHYGPEELAEDRRTLERLGL